MAMTYTDNASLFAASFMNRVAHETLVDKTDLRAYCTNYGLINGGGSTVSEIAKLAWDDPMAAGNADEVTDATATDVGNSAVSITVARQVLARQVSDLYAMVGSGGPAPGLVRMAQDMANAASLRFTDLICALFTSISAHTNATGADLSVDNLMSSMYTLIQARVPGPYEFFGAPIQVTDFMDSLRAEGGSAEFHPATEAMQSVESFAGYGLHGQWRGIRVHSVDSAPTVSSDRVGVLCGRGTFGYMEGIPSDVVAMAGPGSYASLAPNGAPLFVEFDRSALAANTLCIGNYYVGVQIIENGRAIKITSSAT